MVSFLIMWEQAVQCINLGFFGLEKSEVILDQNLDILDSTLELWEHILKRESTIYVKKT